MTYEDQPPLPKSQGETVVRAANEGVPVAVIARIIQQPFADVSDHLKDALACGNISSMPAPDWPPTAKWSVRIPSIARSAQPEEMLFQCKKLFKLTKLEAAFLVVLLRTQYVEKEKLHGVIEEQRAKRPLRPNKQETTDPKMVDVIICKLRKKLRNVDEGFVLMTSWGDGYYFEAVVKKLLLARLETTNGASGDINAGGPNPEREADTGGAS